MRRKRLSIAIAAVAATSVAGVGYAAVPSGDGTIHGCYVVTGASTGDSSSYKSVAVYCPPGKRVIGGGARISGTGDWIGQYGVAITDSWPHDYYDPSTNGQTGWAAGAREISSGYTSDWRLHAFAICASVAT
jgi:hypothetical protein